MAGLRAANLHSRRGCRIEGIRELSTIARGLQLRMLQCHVWCRCRDVTPAGVVLGRALRCGSLGREVPLERGRLISRPAGCGRVAVRPLVA